MGIVGSPRTLGRWCDCWPLTMAESTCTSCWRLGWCDPTLQKMGNMWARGPWRNQHFQQQRAMIFFNLRSVSWTSIVGKLPRNAMRTWSTTHFQYLSMVFAGDCSPHHLHFFLKTISFILHFSVPWPTAGTSSCPHCSFAIHIYMLGWTTAGWASHRHVSIQGHIWSLCTMFTAYRFAAFQQLYSVQNSRTTKSAQRINAHILQFMKDESSRAYYQERYRGPPTHPPKPPQAITSNKQRSNMYASSSKMNHQERTIKNVITPRHSPPKTPQATSSVATCMSILSVRWTMFETPQRSWSDNVRHLYVTSTTLNASSSYTTSM